MKKGQHKSPEREALSSIGIYGPWYLRPSQLDLYELLHVEKRPFLECARRFGKTTSIGAFVLEMLRQNSNWIARWCFPWKAQAREVLFEEMEKLQMWTPYRLKFRYHTTDSVFKGPNGSKLYIRGVNDDNGESARGPAANIVVCDEYGFWKDPKYVVQSILEPQLENQDGQWLIKCSTPPPDLGHLYYADRERSMRLNRYIKKTIFDNEALTEEELRNIIEEAGGIDSPAFRRERLCEPVAEENLLVIPEWLDEENIVEDDYPRPEFFTPYVGGDSGADDLTGIIFGYYDFQRDEFVAEYEIAVSGRTTGEITDMAKIIEHDLWGHVKPKKRVYDADKQLIFDLYGEYKYPMQMADKTDKRAAIHDLRIRVQKRKFKVKRRCTHLIRQMKLGMWKDEKKLDFQRSDGLGHLDLVAAAIYLNRSIDTSVNPVPLNYGLHREQHFIHPAVSSRAVTTEDKLAKLLGGRTMRRTAR